MPVALSTTLTDPTGHVPLAVSVVGVVLVAIVAVVGVLALTGYVAARRRDESQRVAVDARIRAANSALAVARAEDEGWDPEALRAAAVAAARALGVAHPSAVDLSLVSVDDLPGVEHDRATFTVAGGARTHEIVLGRGTDGGWRAV